MWRHWYGLAQAWGSTTYDWTLGQILPRSREGCQQNLTEALSQGRHGFTVRETLPWKNTHMGLPEGESAYPIHGKKLAQRGDCRILRRCSVSPSRIHPPGSLKEPHDEIMLSQGPAVHCIVVSRNSGYIHFQGGGWQPTLQPFLQERKHYSNRASSGVFSVRRTPGREQTPFQCVGLPCWRSPSLNDGLPTTVVSTTAVDVPKQPGPCPEPRGCLPVACSAPARAGGICCDNSMPGHLF